MGRDMLHLLLNEDKLVGIDVNVKHNLFSLSNGETYDYDRNLVNDFCNLSMEIDKLKSKNKDYKIGKRKQFKLDALRLKIKKKEKSRINLFYVQDIAKYKV